ncbi:aminotransferase [Rhizobiaceae bacterium n13]|uniref:aspartate transaminase n=1 Tax=Ferirhizobium litorale TaxID=2927786 RepID=A0AAE3U1L5_9HYPH|nr:aminotransferase [Fererhizobium litorale]MDI7861881.1 aminotransferase [Fererhizobium litorale]MDI7921777.1 aminotransferase [Fererhizobium litorale]
MPHPAFNPLVASLSQPPVPAVLSWAQAYHGQNGPLIDLSQAVPGYPAHPDMLRWLSEAAGSTDYTGYGAIEGESVLREAYVQHVSTLYGATIAADHIHITSGANQAFMCAAMAIAGAGDRLAMTIPFYFNQETTLSMLGVGTVFIECDASRSFLPDTAAVEAALVDGVKALVLVTPNNPTGAVYPAGLLREIFDICRRKGVWLVLDETYRDFLPEGAERPHELLSIPGWEDTLILLYSFSKSFCIPGHRLGAITAGPAVIEQVTKIMDNLQICAPRAAQAALAKAIPTLDDWRRGNREEIMHRTDALKAVMADLPMWRMEAVGAYFAFIRHPFEGVSSAFVAERLAKDAGVVCLPGVYFGPGQEPFLRFAFANADVPTIGTLRERLASFNLPSA